MTEEELLRQLRDIQPPLEPPWWLLAPAHLAILALVITGLVGAYLVLKQLRRHQLTRLAESELQRIENSYREHGDSGVLAIELSRWLRQVSLLAFPAEHVQGITGNRWLEFLDRDLGNRDFTQGCGQLFGSAVYQPRPDFDTQAIMTLCKRWLRAVKPRLQQQGTAR